MRAVFILLIGLVCCQWPAQCASAIEDYQEGWRKRGQGHRQEAIRYLEASIEEDPSFEPAYLELMAAFGAAKQFREGEHFFRNIKLTHPLNALASLGIADELEEQKRSRDAVSFYRDCAEHSSVAESCIGRLTELTSLKALAPLRRVKTASAGLALASFYAGRGRCTEGLSLAQSALALAEREHSLLLQAKTHGLLGAVYERCHADGDKALDEWMQAERSFSEAREPEGRLNSLSLQVGFECKANRFEEGLLTVDRLLQLAKEAGHLRWESSGLRSTGHCYELSGDDNAAIATFRQALDLDLATDPYFDYSMLVSACRRAGRFNEALDWARQSLRWNESVGTTGRMAFDLENISDLELQTGDYFDALASADRAAKLFGKAAMPWQEGAALGDVGDVYSALGDFDSAIRYMRRSLDSGRRRGDQNEIQRVLADLGGVYFRAGDMHSARECLREAASYSDEVHWEVNDVNINLSLAEVMGRLGENTSAVSRARMAAGGARKLASKPLLAEAVEALGERELEASLTADAEKDLQQALGIAGEAIMRPVMSDAQSALARLELRRHNPEQAWQHARSAVEVIEQMRGSITAGDQRISFLKEKSSAFDLALETLAALRVEHPSGTFDQTAFEYAERSRSRAFLDMLRETHVESPGRAEQSFSVSDAEAVAARTGCDILEFFLGENRSAGFLVDATSVQMWDLPPARSIDGLVSKLREEIAKRPNSSADLNRYAASSERLYRVLLGPAGSSLKPDSKLLIIPAGSLYYLPFEVLRSPGHRLLIEDHEIAYAPSVAVFAKLREAPSAVQGRLLALGDPTFGEAQGGTDAIRSMYERGGMHFSRLPNTRLEVQKIAGLYPEQERRVYLADKAVKSIFQNDDLKSYRVVHIASHGFSDDRNPAKSGILLSSNGAFTNSLLTVPEIFKLHLNADLVVLSACETGLGKLVKGEGMLGLTRAFLYAGSSRVVVSLWRVDDSFTSDLMETFHRHMRGGESPAHALRSAKLEALRSARSGFAHPYFWAPFVDVGLF
jgi:CHAT domain-containing protein/tetratricopeptide (TPR) repeat protein